MGVMGIVIGVMVGVRTHMEDLEMVGGTAVTGAGAVVTGIVTGVMEGEEAAAEADETASVVGAARH